MIKSLATPFLLHVMLDYTEKYFHSFSDQLKAPQNPRLSNKILNVLIQRSALYFNCGSSDNFPMSDF